MQIALFYHSVMSDWNNGNAHFLRGVIRELQARGHDIKVYEPHDGWSISNLVREYGSAPLERFTQTFSKINVVRYDQSLDLDAALDQADLVLVHEWNDPALVARIGQHHSLVGDYVLLFHDTHHRSVTAPQTMSSYDLRHYDGTLVFGVVIRELYEKYAWTEQAWVWHEAADTQLFKPLPRVETVGDIVWVGNWGDDERTQELREFLIHPIHYLNLQARIYGVRYPESALEELTQADIEYAGWLPNAQVPHVFAEYKATVHVMRRPYVEFLPGIPTIRVFEALACGIPLVCTPWNDLEGLFTSGEDFLVAENGNHMTKLLKQILHDQDLAQHLSSHGLKTIRSRHTCKHRVDELLAIYEYCSRQVFSAESSYKATLPAFVSRTYRSPYDA